MLRHINLIFILFFFSLTSSANDGFRFYEEREIFLPVEEAFQLSIIKDKDEKQLSIEINNAAGYYTYKDKFKITLEPS
ncbi:MAG: hypothetical protein HN895_04450, partial [Nitrosomonadales bacterium]|nr:hypothetical protein [Nitrosomonadales bacterium]